MAATTVHRYWGPCGQRAGLPSEVLGPPDQIFNEEGTGDGFELVTTEGVPGRGGCDGDEV